MPLYIVKQTRRGTRDEERERGNANSIQFFAAPRCSTRRHTRTRAHARRRATGCERSHRMSGNSHASDGQTLVPQSDRLLLDVVSTNSYIGHANCCWDFPNIDGRPRNPRPLLPPHSPSFGPREDEKVSRKHHPLRTCVGVGVSESD